MLKRQNKLNYHSSIDNTLGVKSKQQNSTSKALATSVWQHFNYTRHLCGTSTCELDPYNSLLHDRENHWVFIMYCYNLITRSSQFCDNERLRLCQLPAYGVNNNYTFNPWAFLVKGYGKPVEQLAYGTVSKRVFRILTLTKNLQPARFSLVERL